MSRAKWLPKPEVDPGSKEDEVTAKIGELKAHKVV